VLLAGAGLRRAEAVSLDLYDRRGDAAARAAAALMRLPIRPRSQQLSLFNV
jgi:hypothetical protein